MAKSSSYTVSKKKNNKNSFSSLKRYNSSHKRSPWFSHKSTPRAQAMCLLVNRIFVYTFQAKTPSYIKSQHVVTRRLLSMGAVCANAHAYVMFLVRLEQSHFLK